MLNTIFGIKSFEKKEKLFNYCLPLGKKNEFYYSNPEKRPFLGAIRMFQTEPILYLQSLGNECFTFLMVLITTLGSPSFLVAVLVMTTFGVDFKKGVLLFQLLMWTLMVIAVLKTNSRISKAGFRR